jgi:hypothetical protein
MANGCAACAFADDRQPLRAISGGEFALHSVRNRDLQRLLFAHHPTATPAEQRRRSAWVGRRLRLLRAHGVIRKVPTHFPLPRHDARRSP